MTRLLDCAWQINEMNRLINNDKTVPEFPLSAHLRQRRAYNLLFRVLEELSDQFSFHLSVGREWRFLKWKLNTSRF
jgi:hypothetical protein